MLDDIKAFATSPVVHIGSFPVLGWQAALVVVLVYYLVFKRGNA